MAVLKYKSGNTIKTLGVVATGSASLIMVSRVTTEVFGDGYRHRFLKSSLPNLNTELAPTEAILSVVNTSSVPMISSQFEYDGEYVTVSLTLIGGGSVTNAQTLTILYR